MPEREEYEHAFDGNPFEGLSNREIFTELRWGDAPNEEWKIIAQEPLASLGEAAKLKMANGKVLAEWGEDEGPFLAVGANTNGLYLIPRQDDGGPIERIVRFNEKRWNRLGKVRQIDYYSTKDGQDILFYHIHPTPLPVLWQHPKSAVCILMPADNKGKPSYGVVAEGIVG